MSPTQRSLKELRARGYTCEVTEHWNPYSKTRHDLFGFCDILAFNGTEVLAVQTTTGAHVSKRVAKIQSNPLAKAWNTTPGRGVVVHGWAVQGPRGKRKVQTLREVWPFAQDHVLAELERQEAEGGR